jgi:hypothetical protein
MKKVNVEEKTRKLNEFRMSNLNKSFTGLELNDAITQLGFTKTMASKIAQLCFPFEKVGSGRLYGVPKEPIHKSFISGLYVATRKAANERNKIKAELPTKVDTKLLDKQKAWDILVEAGIIKAKFNLNTLKAKYPKVYLDCLEYELINPGK